MFPISSLSLQSMYLICVTIGVFTTFIALFLPSIVGTKNPKPEAVGCAVAGYVMMAFGLLLIGGTGIPTIAYLLSGTMMPGNLLTSIALVFVTGIGITVLSALSLSRIDDTSVAVPRAIFHHSCQVLGGMVATISTLSLILQILLTNDSAGWETSVSILLAGTLLAVSFSLHTKPRNTAGFVQANHVPLAKTTRKKK